MPFDDDSDVSSSSSDYFENPNKAKRAALLRRMQREGVHVDPTKAGAQDLQGLKLKVLRAQVQTKDDAQKDRNDKTNAKPLGAATKTREEQITAAHDASVTPVSADMVMQQAIADDARQQEVQQEEVSSEGGA